MIRWLSVLLFSLAGMLPALAQSPDTLALTLKQADSLFLRNNYTLLASQYQVEAQKALEIQARIYPNPTFTADLNAYDPQNNKEFHIGQTGQKAFSLEQLVLLGGKRMASIQLAKQNTILAQLEFEDLVNDLRLQLHVSFYTLQQQTFVLHKYAQQLSLLDTLISAYEKQAEKGNIPLKDVVRLKSAYLKINNDWSALARLHTEETRKMQVLLQQEVYIQPVVDEKIYGLFVKTPDLQNLYNLALSNRPEARIADTQVLISLINLRYEKAQAIPDISLFTSYDQRGGAFNNQINAGFSIPLPFWNRNQGNIRAAQWGQKGAETLQLQKQQQIRAEVQEALVNMLRSIQEFEKVRQLYTDDFETVARGVSNNFQKRNLSIIEFIDFFEAYNESVAERQRIYIQLVTCAEVINYVTASPIYVYE